jgi:carbon storage regulator
MVGENVEIMVVGIRADKVRLGIKAPEGLPVHRKEVYEAIQRDAVYKDARQKFEKGR